jgi:plastocyanin
MGWGKGGKTVRERKRGSKDVLAILAIASLAFVIIVSFVIPLMPEGRSASTIVVHAAYPNFNPATETIQVGDTITWHNDDSFAHTIVSDNLSWGDLSLPASSEVSHTFDALGTYDYHCGIHPAMIGTIEVQSTLVPEFPGLFLVVAGLLALFLSIAIASRKR